MLNYTRKADTKAAIDAAVQALADEVRQPFATVKLVYERELVALQTDARIKDYVALFAGRRTREVLQRGGH